MPLKTHRDEAPTLNLTPMIDIVFLLVIFFMVGTKFSEMERQVELSVPQVGEATALAPAPRKRVINVYQNGTIQIDGKDVSLAGLRGILTTARESYDGAGVIVRGDRQTDFEHVAEVITACRNAGISEMGISVRVARKER